MNAGHKCESCGMPIEAGVYCQYCVDENGKLQEFDVRLGRMVDWMLRQNKASSRAEAEKQALAYMATMPAWRGHPKVVAAARGKSTR